LSIPSMVRFLRTEIVDVMDTDDGALVVLLLLFFLFKCFPSKSNYLHSCSPSRSNYSHSNHHDHHHHVGRVVGGTVAVVVGDWMILCCRRVWVYRWSGRSLLRGVVEHGNRRGAYSCSDCACACHHYWRAYHCEPPSNRTISSSSILHHWRSIFSLWY